MAASVFAVTGEDHDFPAKKAEIGTPRKLLGGERTVKRVDQVHKARADTQYGNAEGKASFRFLHCDGSSAASQTAFVTASCRRWLSAAVGERRGEVSPQSERCFAVRPLRPRISERPRLVGTASATWPASPSAQIRDRVSQQDASIRRGGTYLPSRNRTANHRPAKLRRTSLAASCTPESLTLLACSGR